MGFAHATIHAHPTEVTYEKGQVELYAGGQSHQLNVDIATTPRAREQGLMHRKTWGDIDGMLFVFAAEHPRSFWMKNTYLPLDVVYFDSNGKFVNVVSNTTPLSEKPIPSSGPVQYVLELPAGAAKDYKLDDSAYITLDNLGKAN